MATLADKLTLKVAAACYKDMLEMVEQEKKMRGALLEAVSDHYTVYQSEPNSYLAIFCRESQRRKGRPSNCYRMTSGSVQSVRRLVSCRH